MHRLAFILRPYVCLLLPNDGVVMLTPSCQCNRSVSFSTFPSCRPKQHPGDTSDTLGPGGVEASAPVTRWIEHKRPPSMHLLTAGAGHARIWRRSEHHELNTSHEGVCGAAEQAVADHRAGQEQGAGSVRDCGSQGGLVSFLSAASQVEAHRPEVRS